MGVRKEGSVSMLSRHAALGPDSNIRLPEPVAAHLSGQPR